MTQQAELLKEIDGLPPPYLGEIIDFAGYLRQKARREADEAAASAGGGELRLTKAELEEIMKGPHPITDALSGILSDARGITLEQIRDERLAKHTKHLK